MIEMSWGQTTAGRVSDWRICSVKIFSPLAIIPEALSCFVLYQPALRKRTDLILTAISVETCMEIHWKKIAARNGFARYDFKTGEAYGPEENSVRVRNRARGDLGSPTAVP